MMTPSRSRTRRVVCGFGVCAAERRNGRVVQEVRRGDR